MIELAPRNAISPARVGVQPIAVAAVALVLVLFGVGSIALWRALSGNSPELERAAAVRQLQARTAQVSEQLIEKTKAIDATQQETIDQLQVAQDQLQTVRRQLAAQQADNKKLSEQVAALNEAIEGLRQSFASNQSNDSVGERSTRERSERAKPERSRSAQRRRSRSRG